MNRWMKRLEVAQCDTLVKSMYHPHWFKYTLLHAKDGLLESWHEEPSMKPYTHVSADDTKVITV